MIDCTNSSSNQFSANDQESIIGNKNKIETTKNSSFVQKQYQVQKDLIDTQTVTHMDIDT